MEARRVKRFQIGDSISPSSFLPVKRKSKSKVVDKQVSLNIDRNGMLSVENSCCCSFALAPNIL